MSQKNTPLKTFLTLLVLFSITSFLLLFTVDVTVSDEAGVKTHLPKQLEDAWEGYDVLFCQKPSCGRSWLTRDIAFDENGMAACPTNWQGEPCGGELLTMSAGEKLVLPSDTVILKKKYFEQEVPENSVFTSVVLSGIDRTSIHRPEVCMVAQGHVIENQEVIDVQMENGPPLKVMVMQLTRKLSENVSHHSYYAYFFIGRDRTTPYHFERMAWMSLDRIFRNVAHKWAYIAVAGERDADLTNTDHYEEIRDVVSKLYPQISLLETAL